MNQVYCFLMIDLNWWYLSDHGFGFMIDSHDDKILVCLVSSDYGLEDLGAGSGLLRSSDLVCYDCSCLN
jgi:hypothetical protein